MSNGHFSLVHEAFQASANHLDVSNICCREGQHATNPLKTPVMDPYMAQWDYRPRAIASSTFHST